MQRQVWNLGITFEHCATAQISMFSHASNVGVVHLVWINISSIISKINQQYKNTKLWKLEALHLA